MLRKLLIIGCLLISSNLIAQPDHIPAPPRPGQAPLPPGTTNYKEIGAPLPDFKIVTSKGTVITNEDLKNKANLFVMIFNPTCSHCEDQTELLEKNIDLFKKSKVVFVASDVASVNIPFFEKGLHTDNYKPFIIGTDSCHYVDKMFLYQMLPQINIYDKHRKLVKIFTGGAAIDSLKPYIQ